MDMKVRTMIEKYIKWRQEGNFFLSIKPKINCNGPTVAHLYSSGGKVCQFNYPDGREFHRYSKEYEKYNYNCGQKNNDNNGFSFVFHNYDYIVKLFHNRAIDKDNHDNGIGESGVGEYHNYYERMRENQIAAYNYCLSRDKMAVIDMEYTVPLNNGQKAKADLICVSIDDNKKLHFYVTEYKSTESGFGSKNSLRKHFDDMSAYSDKLEVKEHLLKTLKERISCGLIETSHETQKVIANIESKNIIVEILFMFSDKKDMDIPEIKKKLDNGYKYICKNPGTISSKYMYIPLITKDCLSTKLLKEFSCKGKFDFI